MHSYADADGVRIHCIDHGGTGPPLLLMHATGFHARVWDPVIDRLRAHMRVFAIDQRGHGDSDKPASGYEWPNFGRDVLAAVDHLGLEHPAGVGHSAGAAALIFAETMRPGTFSRLVLMDPVTPHPDIRAFFGSRENPLAAGARRRRRIWDSHEQMIARLQERSPLQTWREEWLRAYVEGGTRTLEDGTIELKCPPEIEAQVYERGGGHDGWERLAQLTCPTLLLAGEHSELWPPDRRDAAAKQLSDGRVEIVPGGHFFPMENPDETFDRAIGFLPA